MTSHLILSLTFTPKCAAQWSGRECEVSTVDVDVRPRFDVLNKGPLRAISNVAEMGEINVAEIGPGRNGRRKTYDRCRRRADG